MKTEGIEGTERFASPGKGRGLRALKHFKVGDLVFACPAYAYVLTVNERSSHCEFCFTRREGLSKCGRCKQAFYCNVDCQRGDWPMHKLECSAMCSYGDSWSPSETVRLAARIITKQKTLTERTASERVLALREFESHLDKLDNEKREMNQTDVLALHHFYSKHLDFPSDEALTELFAQVNCNGFTIEDEELSHLGSAVFPDVALMNHSCSPNVIVTYKGTVAEVRAVQEISPGDEIFNSYIDLLYPTEDRNERLRDSYFFTCDCKECSTRSKDKAKMKIRKLSTPPEQDEIQSMVGYAKNIIEEFRRAKHYKNILVCSAFLSDRRRCLQHLDSIAPPSELLEICELSLEKMGTVFDETNVYMLHMMYQAMGVFHYPPYSLNVASMYLKLGRLYLGLEKKSLGIKALKKAIAIMEVAHGKDHHYLDEIRKEMEEQQ
ncbi:hypothetical protein JZ751_002643 [Albula glossodonta]|uniref:[histone H3]-lysine(4) N-trimethyltransferase n=1 Tax=Albula glossodonta TaxID=121402 RepID=A0A8T2N8P0_9TELE|nr:hypothetical protein JZ751_002643 [Albula glossodonta]